MTYKYVLTQDVRTSPDRVYLKGTVVYQDPESYWTEDADGLRTVLTFNESADLSRFLHQVAMTAEVVTIYDDELSRSAGQSGSKWYDAVSDGRNFGPNVPFVKALEKWITDNLPKGIDKYTFTIAIAPEAKE